MNGRRSKEERWELILRELAVRPHVRVSDLAERFDVTTETIRRDLDALSEKGLVNRAYGGASARPMGTQPPAREREREAVAERARIGAAAAELVASGEVVMIDAGSTTRQMGFHLAARGLELTVITNCFSLAVGLEEGGARVVMCPGSYDGRESAVYGPDTLDYLRRFHANKTFIGASGLSVDGPCDVNREAAWIKRAMIERAEEVWLLADHTKFEARMLEVVAPLSQLTGLVTDRKPPAALANALDRAGTRLVIAGEAESERQSSG